MTPKRIIQAHPNLNSIKFNSFYGYLQALRREVSDNILRVGRSTELQLNRAKSFDIEAPFLDFDLSVTNDIVSFKNLFYRYLKA